MAPARAFDVTVEIAASLRSAFDGKERIHLGVPASARFGDVLETLLRLYPKLQGQLASERERKRPYLHVALDERASRELARGQSGLSPGQRVFLFALAPEAGGRAGVEG